MIEGASGSGVNEDEPDEAESEWPDHADSHLKIDDAQTSPMATHSKGCKQFGMTGFIAL
jgi:hypothetical protein